MSGDKPDEKDSDRTPVEPFMMRKRSSQRAMTAIGWHVCPACDGDERIDCELCFDDEDLRCNRRVPIDVLLKYLQEHPEKAEIYRAKHPEVFSSGKG